MQVTVHSVENAVVRDFTPAEKRSHASQPFVTLTIEDGKSSEVSFILSSVEEAYNLMIAAEKAHKVLMAGLQDLGMRAVDAE